MRKIPVLITIGCLILLGSCNNPEEETVVIPIANFDFEGPYGPIFPTFDAVEFIDKSTNGDTYLWDFGNGDTSTEKAPYYDYPVSGTYTITLTVTSSTGEKSTATKSIKIIDRILESIEIKRLEWNAFGDFPDWSDDKTADVYVEILVGGNLFYKSAVVTGISEHSAPLTILVNEKLVINPDDVILTMAIRLTAIDNGEENIIFQSNWSGIGLGSSGDGNLYQIHTGANGTTIYLNSGYK